MMRKCWETSPDDRPTFNEMYTNTSKYIEHIAGYLEMGFNPFAVEGKDYEAMMSKVALQVVQASVQNDMAYDTFIN